MTFFEKRDLFFYNEEPILTMEKLVLWKKKRNIYNFKKLPDIAIIGLEKQMFFKSVSFWSKKIKGIKGNHYLYKSKFLLCCGFGYGSATFISFLEELRCLGVKKFIFIGVAGVLKEKINKAYSISKVHSSVGASFFYYPKEEIDVYDTKWSTLINEICDLESEVSWCTDAPFRETPSLVNNYINKECAFVDMEVAGLYAFSQFYKLSSTAILIPADSLINDFWEQPKSLKEIVKKKQELVHKICQFL